MRSGDITPFTEYRQHLREHFERVKESGRPLFVTTHGKPDAVILSPDRYDELVEAEALLRSLETIDKSTEDIRAGRTRPMREGLSQLAREEGLDRDR